MCVSVCVFHERPDADASSESERDMSRPKCERCTRLTPSYKRCVNVMHMQMYIQGCFVPDPGICFLTESHHHFKFESVGASDSVLQSQANVINASQQLTMVKMLGLHSHTFTLLSSVRTINDSNNDHTFNITCCSSETLNSYR